MVKNSHLCSSLARSVTVLNNEKLTMKYNTFYNNGGFGQYDGEIFHCRQVRRPCRSTTGRLVRLTICYDLGTVLTGNNFENALRVRMYLGRIWAAATGRAFAYSLVASGNRWYDPHTAYSFKLPSNHVVNFSGWKSAVGTDYSSYWATPIHIAFRGVRHSESDLHGLQCQPGQGKLLDVCRTCFIAINVNNYGYGTVSLSVSGLPSNVSASLKQL